MPNLTDLFAQGASITSTDARAGTIATDSATSQADYLIVFPLSIVPNNNVNRGVLYGIDGQNNSATAKWLFVFDYASIAGSIPANGTGPFANAKLLHSLYLPANTASGGQFGFTASSSGGEAYTFGLCLVVSTTGPTQLTVDTAKSTYISCQYAVSFPGY